MLQINVYRMISIQKLFVANRNICRRLLGARKNRNWTDTQWLRVAFINESCFLVRPARNYPRVCHMKGERLHPDHIVLVFKSGYQFVSASVFFSKYRRSALVGYCGTFTITTFRTIIDEHLLPFKLEKHHLEKTYTRGAYWIVYDKLELQRSRPYVARKNAALLYHNWNAINLRNYIQN